MELDEMMNYGPETKWTLRLTGMLAGLHVLLFAAFFHSLLLAAEANANQVSGCNGKNLVERLQSESPAQLAAARSEAAEIANGRSIFWRVSRPGVTDSWLFGTMHTADPRIARLPGEVEAAFDRAQIVLIENTDALEPAKMAEAMMRLRHLAFLPADRTLDAMLPAELAAQLREHAEMRNMPWELARRMQPWLIAASIATPICEIQASASGAPVLDRLIAQEAQKRGKQLHGLETIEEQFRAVAAIPEQFHRNGLRDFLEMGAISEDLMETTKQLYLQGNTALILPLVRRYSPRTDAGAGYAEFRQLLLTNRNRVMADRAAGFLERGGAFLAVGAMHLPGEDGLVALLRESGFSVEPISMDESPPQL